MSRRDLQLNRFSFQSVSDILDVELRPPKKRLIPEDINFLVVIFNLWDFSYYCRQRMPDAQKQQGAIFDALTTLYEHFEDAEFYYKRLRDPEIEYLASGFFPPLTNGWHDLVGSVFDQINAVFLRRNPEGAVLASRRMTAAVLSIITEQPVTEGAVKMQLNREGKARGKKSN
jgi:hypothetical protein